MMYEMDVRGASTCHGAKLQMVQGRRSGECWRKVMAVDVEEAKAQVMFALPMIATNVSHFFITLISVMVAGHIGDLELASSNLANSWGTVTGFALMTGLSGALETLCGQGYGAKLYKMLGVYLQASFISAFVVSILISVLWFYTEPVLISLGQEPKTSEMAGVFLKYQIPGLFAYGFLQCILRFLQTQTIVMPLLICSVIPLVIHVGLAYLLVYRTPLGFKGAPISAAVSLWIAFILLALYVVYSERFKYTWEGLTMESFDHVIPYMKLAIPSAFMVCLEYWAFEILVLLAGLMPNPERSTSLIAICVNTETVAYMTTYGFSAAVSTRVSNELGAGFVDSAKNAVSVTLKLSFILALAIVVLLLFGHDIWARLFSDSDVIIKDFASFNALVAVSIVFDSTQSVLSGVARGCGWQHLAAWSNLAAFYIFGIPFAVFLGFYMQMFTKVWSVVYSARLPFS
ncbi:hypothetical protein Syun_008466 [Stephania yunnanensis]|uniref:Protein DETOXIFICATION n=1 Tax=Stephania yunnanensis TaxID=152371 RepID=A0AAP0PN67_9MAGN